MRSVRFTLFAVVLVAWGCGEPGSRGDWPLGPNEDPSGEQGAISSRSDIPRSSTVISGQPGGGPTGEISLEKSDMIVDNPGWGGMGRTLASAGDVDGDGYEDLLVGDTSCCREIPGLNDVRRGGAVFLLYGGSAPADRHEIGTSEAAFVGEARARMGRGIAGIGDFNADGFDDIAMGAPSRHEYDHPDRETHPRGKVYVFFGREERYSGEIRPSTADLIIEAPAWATPLFGTPVAGADLNGDGAGDLAFASGEGSENEQHTNALWVFYGGRSAPSGTVPASEANAQVDTTKDDISSLGAMADAGDWNRDGTDELLVGATAESGSFGTTYVFEVPAQSRGTMIDGASSNVLMGTASRDFGSEVAGGWDLDGDGIDDAVIGTPVADGIRNDVFEGGRSRPNQVPASNSDFRATARKVLSVPSAVSVGDVNGDGFGDLISATGKKARIYGSSTKDRNYVHLTYGGASRLSGRTSMAQMSDAVFVGSSDEIVGLALATLDFNGDGVDDIAVGAPASFPPGSEEGGRVYLVLGGT